MEHQSLPAAPSQRYGQREGVTRAAQAPPAIPAANPVNGGKIVNLPLSFRPFVPIQCGHSDQKVTSRNSTGRALCDGRKVRKPGSRNIGKIHIHDGSFLCP